MNRRIQLAGSAVAALTVAGGAAFADSIDPTTFDAVLLPGESVTIEKTVTVFEGDPIGAAIDAMFVIDTTGSMGSAIANAQSAAAGLLAGLDDDFDSVWSGTGFYNDPAFDGVNTDLTDNDATTIAALNAFFASGGGDLAEQGNAAVEDAANNASWRPGSSRFIFALGDAPFKDTPPDAQVIAALAANDVTLVGLGFDSAGAKAQFFSSITDLGGSTFDGGTSPDDIVDAVTAGISASFAEYSTVTVDDLGGGAPGVDVSAVCTGADIGSCGGADATGDYDRSEARTFTFDVTFTNVGLGVGETVVFETFALVDGRIVATEVDTISAPIPLPAGAWLLLGGLGGLAALRRRAA